MPNVNLNAPNDWAAQQQEILRRQQLADMLQQQSMQPLQAPVAQGPMGNVTMPISPLEGLSKLLGGYTGMKAQENVRGQQRDLAKNYQTAGNEALAKGLRSLQGTPGSTEIMPMDEEANGGLGQANAPINIPGQAPDRAAAMVALGSHPTTQPYAQAMMAAMLKGDEPYSLAPGAKRFSGGKEVGFNPKEEPISYQNVGDRVVAFRGGVPISQGVPTAVSPNTAATLKQGAEQFAGVSGNTRAQIGSQQLMHATPSGSTLATNQVTREGQAQAVNPAIQGPLAQAKAAGTEFGTSKAKAAMDLPQAVATAKQGVDLIDQMIGDLKVDAKGNLAQGKRAPHPGFEVSIGASAQPGMQYVAGTDKAGFYALKDQVLGGAFMQAYQTLKGGGQITEVEGTKATAAITRMNTAQSEPEFVKAAREFQDVIRAGAQRAESRAQGVAPGVKFLGFE